MEQEYVAPVNHSGFSAAANTTAGAAGGAVKYGLGSALLWIGAFTVGGILLGAALPALGAAGLAGGFGAVFHTLFSAPVILGAIGGAVGLAVGTGTSWLPGGAGAIFGGFKGGAKASARVANERAAAQEMQEQIAMAQAQAYSPTTTNVYANDNKYGFPQQGNAMNPALASVQLDGAQLAGTMVGQQRAAAL